MFMTVSTFINVWNRQPFTPAHALALLPVRLTELPYRDLISYFAFFQLYLKNPRMLSK